MAVNVVLIDDHRVVREGLRAVLARDADLCVIGEAGDGVEALSLCQSLQPDLVLMDIGLPGTTGIQVTEALLRVCPQTRVMIFSVYGDADSIMSAIRAGARGFVVKDSPAQEILTAIRTVVSGGTYFSSQASAQLMARLQRDEPLDEPAPEIGGLSPRETQLLCLLAEGRTNKDIATLLHLEHNTVRSYRKTLMKKLGVSNLAGLLHIAHAAGLVRPGWRGFSR